MPEDKEFDIGDIESFTTGKDMNYSRSASLMRMTNKVQDALSREMKPGFFEIKTDKFGNQIRTLTDDTRKSACSSIETLRNTMECDFDKNSIEELEAIDKKIEEKKEEFLKMEEDEWLEIPEPIRFKLTIRNLGYQKYRFHRDKQYGELFLLFSLAQFRKIFEALMRLQKRKDFYKGESLEG